MQTKSIEQELVEFVTSECSIVDTDRLYDEMIDECYSFDSVGGPFACMSPSRVLAEVDPTAYRCGKNDWLDGEELTEINGDYYQNDELDKAKEEFIEELDNRGTDLETEIEELEADEDPDLQEVARKKRELADLQSDLTEVKKHTF